MRPAKKTLLINVTKKNCQPRQLSSINFDWGLFNKNDNTTGGQKLFFFLNDNNVIHIHNTFTCNIFINCNCYKQFGVSRSRKMGLCNESGNDKQNYLCFFLLRQFVSRLFSRQTFFFDRRRHFYNNCIMNEIINSFSFLFIRATNLSSFRNHCSPAPRLAFKVS